VNSVDVDATPEPVLDEREALVQSIEQDKAELLDAVDELKTAVQQQFQLREQIAEHPIPWLLGGLVVGLWLGSRGKG
jgi:transcriptional regulator of NAD metabolism